MTVQTQDKLELTPEQQAKLGQVYQIILSWRHLSSKPQQSEVGEQLPKDIQSISRNTNEEVEV